MMLDQGYGILPNSILFNKELSDKQKLLFVYISSLCAEKGYCRATNEYIGNSLGCTKSTITVNLSKLKELGFIEIDLSLGYKRKITLLGKITRGVVKNDVGGSEKSIGGDSEKSLHNNIIDNNIKEKYNKVILLTDKDIEKEFIKEYGFIKEFIDINNIQIDYQIKKQGLENYFNKQYKEVVKLKKNGYDLETIKTVLCFIKQDQFWSKQILSIRKLNEKDKNGIPYIIRMLELIKNRQPKVADLSRYNV